MKQTQGRMAQKYALITGGNSGIGAATARLFAQEGAAGIALLDLEKPGQDFYALARELTDLGTQAFALPCDVTESAQVKRAVDAAAERFGRLDVSVHCAGVLDFNASVFAYQRRTLGDYGRHQPERRFLLLPGGFAPYGEAGVRQHHQCLLGGRDFRQLRRGVFLLQACGGEPEQKHRHSIYRDGHPLQHYLVPVPPPRR